MSLRLDDIAAQASSLEKVVSDYFWGPEQIQPHIIVMTPTVHRM